MAKATTTIRQVLNHKPDHGAWLAANQALFNQVAAFYFEVIQAHRRVLELGNQKAMRALEQLTHATDKNPHPVMPLSGVASDIPAMFRRAAIHAALGSARSFFSHLEKWRSRHEKAEAKGKKFHERPPVPPRTWNKSVTLYAGMLRTTGRELPDGFETASPSLVRRGHQWWLHSPVEKQFKNPAKIEQQVTSNTHTKMCAVDLNLGEHLAVCTIQTVEGSILATHFLGGGREISGFRKKLLGRVARNRRKTGVIAEGEQDNAALWQNIRDRDDDLAHRVSARIVLFAKQHGASILVFEHLGKLKPKKGKYSRRGNTKRAFWMKGRIFRYAKYKAWNEGIVTGRVNPRNTSRECARCHALVVRYEEGQPAEGYTPGAPLVLCSHCGMQGHADRNASLVIGQRLITRYQQQQTSSQEQEKPHTSLSRAERPAKAGGVVVSQDAKRKKKPSLSQAGHGDHNGHGIAYDVSSGMADLTSDIPTQLRLFYE
jgi:putative transposase